MKPFLLLAAASGEDTPLRLPADTPAKVASTSGGGTLVRTFVGLAVVIAVIYGVAWVLRQVKASRETSSAGFGLSHAATVALGPNRSVHLIRAGRELVLVGSAEQGVVPIRTYTEAEARALGLLEGEEPEDEAPRRRPAASGSSPLDKLRKATAR